MTEPYENNSDYLSAELARLNLLIRREVSRWRQHSAEGAQDIFRGVFISEGEIDELLDASAEARPDPLQDLEERVAALGEEITTRRAATLEKGIYLPLAHLLHIFSLSEFEERIVFICLAPELEQRYEKFYAYLQDDVTRKRPSLNLVLKLLCSGPAEALQARSLFSAQAPLFRSQLLSHATGDDSHLLTRGLRLDERVVNFLLGSGGLDKQLGACLRPLGSAPQLDDLRWPAEFKAQLLGLAKTYLRSKQGLQSRMLIFNFHGPRGTGRKALAAGLCRELGIPLLVFDMREVLGRYQDFEEAVRRIFREAVLTPGAIYLENFDRLLKDERAASALPHLTRAVEEFGWLTFLGTESAWESDGLFKAHIYLSIELGMPDTPTRTSLWPKMVESNNLVAEDVNWEELSTKFRLTPGQMLNALVAAYNSALLRDAALPTLTADDLNLACRSQSNQKLGASARKLKPSHTWDDLILPRNGLAQMREVCAQLRHRQTVFDYWGFGRKLSLLKGLCVLFYGQSGTGKTLAVEVIANELQLDAYKIDLSTVVSKYIGETEKNLSAIFDEGENSNAILFFDEADALFGKRTEVKDAHDRYANIEINYLLQRMEEFEGLVILATNLRKNIDDAFFRRMQFAIEFPFPDEGNRYHIWKQHFPANAPVSEDIDFDFLATRLNVSGGNIRNIVVNAAFLAAENSGRIGMKHLVRAARREYEKIGRLCNEVEFSPYHLFLKDAEPASKAEAR